MPMPQLLDVAFGVFNNQDQAQEEERPQREKRQARAHAELIAVLAVMVGDLRGSKKVQLFVWK